ncbi:MAG: endonuclease III [Desulfobacterales bacterium]|jgi:endonuclease-3
MKDTSKIRARAAEIRKILRSLYPEVKPQLHFRNPFELLLATILSSQCTDKQVNRVTPKLFHQFKSPQDFARASLEEIEALIRSTGFYRNKAKNIKACCRVLLETHCGRVPDRLDELVELPGVGRKTANVVLGAAFERPGIVVDTHVKRVSRRLGFTENSDPVKIEFDLMEIIPRKDWSDFSLRMVYFGRETCTARKPRCPACLLDPLCPYPDKTVSRP